MQMQLPLGIVVSEFQETTHQVPKGPGSLFAELEAKNLCPFDATVLLTLNYFSDRKKGLSKYISIRDLSRWTQTGVGRVMHSIKRLSFGWIEKKGNRRTHRYQQTYHQPTNIDAPTDFLADDEVPVEDKKFALPYGDNAPIARMVRGEISWQACLVWCVLKLHSDFKTGISDPLTILELAKKTRMSTATLTKVIAELIRAGLLERLTPKHEASIFQLYPKPNPKKRKSKKTQTASHWVSANRKYRCCRQTFNIEKKVWGKRNKWKAITDKARAEMPKPIAEYFETEIRKQIAAQMPPPKHPVTAERPGIIYDGPTHKPSQPLGECMEDEVAFLASLKL